jgi:hypothetical protein
VQQIIQVLFEFPNTDGTAGQVLQTDGYANLSFATVGGGGKVLQVVNATTTTETTTSSNVFVDTDITATITPTSATSKILVHANVAGVGKANNNTYAILKLLRGVTDLITFEQRGGYNNASTANKIGTCACTYLDAPSTTSATTYKVQLASGGNSNFAQSGDSNPTSTITLIEIAG